MPSQMYANANAGPWRKTIKGIAPLVDAVPECDDHDPAPEGLADKIAEILQAAHAPEDIVQDFRNVDLVYELNDALEDVYDWADEHRVWIDPLN